MHKILVKLYYIQQGEFTRSMLPSKNKENWTPDCRNSSQRGEKHRSAKENNLSEKRKRP